MKYGVVISRGDGHVGRINGCVSGNVGMGMRRRKNNHGYKSFYNNTNSFPPRKMERRSRLMVSAGCESAMVIEYPGYFRGNFSTKCARN